MESEMEMVEDEPVYRLTYLTGVAEIKPVEHFLTWLDHDNFEVRSEIMTMTGCRVEDLGMVLAHFQPITFVNEHPPAPPSPLRRLWDRIVAAPTPDA